MTSDRGLMLLTLARGAIGETWGEARPSLDPAGWLQEPGSTFVTLTSQGELRGCVGNLSTQRPLGEGLAINARAAAFHDPRFAPLTHQEFAETEIEVSLLSTPEKIPFDSEAHLLTLLRPGIDGLILEYGSSKSTFLPQVWEELPEPRVFLEHLKQKAGLPKDFWAPEIQIARYSVKKWRESDVLGR